MSSIPPLWSNGGLQAAMCSSGARKTFSRLCRDWYPCGSPTDTTPGTMPSRCGSRTTSGEHAGHTDEPNARRDYSALARTRHAAARSVRHLEFATHLLTCFVGGFREAKPHGQRAVRLELASNKLVSERPQSALAWRGETQDSHGRAGRFFCMAARPRWAFLFLFF